MKGAYYNEFDPYAAQWLRNLVAAGHIAPGDVDERSIVDVRPDDLRDYGQCHFFAGIGVWSYALRRAGWDDARPVWTGSCPCQPFSAAGKKGGFNDERHLWPTFFRLIEARRPFAVFGEQVASKDGLAWLDTVYADLEGAGYACGAVDLCAAGVGAPHIRQRLFFVAHSEHGRHRYFGNATAGRRELERGGELGELAHAAGERRTWERVLLRAEETGRDSSDLPETSGSRGTGELAHALPAGRPEGWPVAGSGSAAGGCGSGVALGDANDARLEGRGLPCTASGRDSAGERAAGSAGPTNGFWRDADWLPCIDGKARPVEPGTFPLAHGIAGRVGRLRAYGNAINAEAATEFLRACREVMP